MAKRSKKRKASGNIGFSATPAPQESGQKSLFSMLFSGVWMPLLLAMVAFGVYAPSLRSDFVYDARTEIIEEGFITSLSNLPAVLSLKVLGMNLMLGTRPGQLLYLMLIAAVCGKEPFGYHLCSNLLHAANVALLFILLRRLLSTEITGLVRRDVLKVQLATVAVTLIFALHPLAVESVAEVSYSSGLLVTFFTLLALLAATAFHPENFRAALITGALGTLCVFFAVTCKESGLTATLLLIAYRFLFRRQDTNPRWLWFLGAAMMVTAVFLAARFLLAPPAQEKSHYLGGSFFHALSIQPRLWVSMMGKLVWPVQLSASYTLENVSGISTIVAFIVLFVVVLLQVGLAAKSRIGALGVALYWLGLVTVSNFIPLYCPMADRFYYLPLAGVAMQLLALLLMTLKSGPGFWVATTLVLGAILPLTLLTLTREEVFASNFSLWSDTVQASPFSSTAHYNFGNILLQKKRVDEAIAQFQKALEIRPAYSNAHDNLGLAYTRKGQNREAIAEFQKASEIDPNNQMAHDNLGNAFAKNGQMDEAMAEFQKALAIKPNDLEAHGNLGAVLLQKGRIDDAMVQFQIVLAIDPTIAETHCNIGNVLLLKGRADEAIIEFQEALRLKPDFPAAQEGLTQAQARIRQKAGQK